VFFLGGGQQTAIYKMIKKEQPELKRKPRILKKSAISSSIMKQKETKKPLSENEVKSGKSACLKRRVAALTQNRDDLTVKILVDLISLSCLKKWYE
jgi:hypothetical protein